jgi:hypothetical protein
LSEVSITTSPSGFLDVLKQMKLSMEMDVKKTPEVKGLTRPLRLLVSRPQ